MQGRPNGLLGALGAILLTTMTAAAADVYRWEDEDGNVHFSDSPPKQRQSEAKDVPDVQTVETVNVSTRQTQASQTNSTGAPEVVMYGTEWCPHCKRAREYFQANGIDFREYDVEKSAKGKRFMKRSDANGIPVILVGNHRMTGFSQGRFDQLYQRAQ